MIAEVISELLPSVEATGLISNAYGLCELVNKDDREFPVYYIGRDNAVSVSEQDPKNGVAWFMRNGETTTEDLESPRENDRIIRQTIPVRFYAWSGRKVYDDDAPQSPEILAQNMRAALVRATMPQLRQVLGISRAFTEATAVNTNTREVLEIYANIPVQRLDHVAVYIDLNVVLIGREECFVQYACKTRNRVILPAGILTTSPLGEALTISPSGDYILPSI
jgi:hypothetical protein